MKVYVLSGCFDWETCNVLAAYKDKEKAEAALKVAEDEPAYDSYHIDEVDIIE